jgi:hypothetical protein
MIHLPAEATGLRFELDPETGQSLDTALLEAMAVDAKPLPLLEHLLWQLYRKQLSRKDGVLCWSDYHELGKLDGALANHAESVFLALGENAQAALKFVIRQLVSTGPSEKGVLIRGSVPYRDLVSTPEFTERQKIVAEGVIDRFVKEGLFHAEKTGPNAEVQVGITQECLLRNWPRVRQLLKEELEPLRVRDRLAANFKRWLSRGRRGLDLLHAGPGVSEATLLRSFRASLGYLQKSLERPTARRWLRNNALLALGAGLVIFLTILPAKWLNADIERKKVEKSGDFQGQMTNSAEQSEVKVERGQNNAELVASERDALQARLKDTEVKAQKAQKNMELVASQRDVFQARLKDAEPKAQEAQNNAELAASQRDAFQAQLKDAEVKAQQAQKNAEVAIDQLSPLQAELEKVQEKVQSHTVTNTPVAPDVARVARFTPSLRPSAQKIADPVAARPQIEEAAPSDGEPRQKNIAFDANQTGSEQSQPPNAGLKVGPETSTQPLSSTIRTAQTSAMSSSASAPIAATADARNEQNRGSEAASPIAVKFELVPKIEPLVGVEQRNR